MGTYLSRVFHYASHKRRPLSVTLFMGASLSSFLHSTFVAYVFKVRVLRLSFSMVGGGGGRSKRRGNTGNTKRGAFLQSSERQLFALNYKWTRLTPSLASHLSQSPDDERSKQGAVSKYRSLKCFFALQ